MLVCLPFGIGHFIVFAGSWALLMGVHIYAMANGFSDDIFNFGLFMCCTLSITIVSGLIFFVYSCGTICCNKKVSSGQYVGYTGILIGSVVGTVGTTSFYSVSDFTTPNCMLIIYLYCGCVAFNTGLYIWLWCIKIKGSKKHDTRISPEKTPEVGHSEVGPEAVVLSYVETTTNHHNVH